MTARALSRGPVLVPMVTILVSLAGCGGGSSTSKQPVGPADLPCNPSLLKVADPAAKLPAGFPVLDAQVLYEPSTQGKTQILFGRVATADFVAVRDQLVTKLTSAGYKIAGTDQESVEAEAYFLTPQNGSVKVQPLCKGNVSIRYKFSN